LYTALKTILLNPRTAEERRFFGRREEKGQDTEDKEGPGGGENCVRGSLTGGGDGDAERRGGVGRKIDTGNPWIRGRNY